MLSLQARGALDAFFANREDTLRCFLTEPLSKQRDDWESFAASRPLPPDMCFKSITLCGMSGTLIEPSAGTEQSGRPSKGSLLVHFHGGGLTQGSPVTHRHLGAFISRDTRMPLFLPDYPLAPEHPFPEAFDVSVSMCRQLLDSGTFERIVIGGDSSGGGLACAVIQQLMKEGSRRPSLVYLLSPLLDNSLSGETLKSKRDVDPRVFEEDLRMNIRYYCEDALLRDPRVSPLFGEVTDFPPVFIQTGSAEILLSDSTRFADTLRAAGVSVELDIWEGMWHVFQAEAEELPEASDAIRCLCSYITEH